MRITAAFLVLLAQLIITPASLSAQGYTASRAVVVERWIEEWDEASQSWVRIDEPVSAQPVSEIKYTSDLAQHPAHEHTYITSTSSHLAARYAVPVATSRPAAAIAQYGPFQVLDGQTAAMVGPTNRMSPHYFDAMLRDFPQIARLDMIEAPGTSDDIANLAVGRRIRAADIATHVPNGGSVRSGAVELFLAGTRRTMEDGAEFAVHSWLDSQGREPHDFAPDAPENRLYLDYYRQMGMSDRRARDFYAMTNSVPHHTAKWLGAHEMRKWLQPEGGKASRKRAIPVNFMVAARPTIASVELPSRVLFELDS